jgi:putative SOS response-associated peptidase YedK
MCSQYTVKIKTEELTERYKINVAGDLHTIDQRILPYQSAPVIVLDHGDLKLTPMTYSLVPNWSADPKVKFATYNARIETIDSKPTWKTPFLQNHCLVPMTAFYESAYVGPLAGNILKFEQKNDDVLFAAGIFDFWKDPVDAGQSFFSFSILTRDPSAFIIDHGHDRTPIFINQGFIQGWLQKPVGDFIDIKKKLLSNAVHPDLKVGIERPLKAGWEKRA